MGIYDAEGEVTIAGKTLSLNNPKEALQSGLAFVSEDRRGVGLLLDQSIENNITITASGVQEKFLKNFGLFKLQDKQAVRNHTKALIEQLDIRCTGAEQPTGQLSGGNQQKVCLARALTLEPKILFVSEPTRGIDIGAKKLVLDLLLELKKQGMTVVITSSELAEIRYVADRIAIISEGKVAGIVKPTASDAKFGLLMSGIKIEEGEKNER
jgi:simple sugar transport system ATP-binding protein